MYKLKRNYLGIYQPITQIRIHSFSPADSMIGRGHSATPVPLNFSGALSSLWAIPYSFEEQE
jgi:hypothetical protein